MQRWVMRTGWILAAALVAAGCSDPAHQKRIERRERSFEKTVRVYVESEARRGRQIDSTVRVIDERIARDARSAERLPDDVGWWLDRDFRRFEERQPRYLRDIEWQLEGDVPSIERTLPLFY